MSTDLETTVSDALHRTHLGATDTALLLRVRAGGASRLRRRRRLVAAGGAAAVLVAVPGALAVTSAHHHPGPVILQPAGAAPAAVDWRQRWPLLTAGAACNRGFATRSTPRQHPRLLLLPPGPVASAFVNATTSTCPTSHTALLAQRSTTAGGHVDGGLVVTGPDAPDPEQDGAVGAGLTYGGRTGHEPVQGRPALTESAGGDTTIWWATADGAQWKARSAGQTWQQAQALVDRLTMDPQAGTAALAPADAAWTPLPPAADVPSGRPAGIAYAQWRDGSATVDLEVRDREESDVRVLHAPSGTAGDVGGHPAVVQVDGTQVIVLWPVDDGVSAELTVQGATPTADAPTALRIARSLTLADPGDPRFTDPGGGTPSATSTG